MIDTNCKVSKIDYIYNDQKYTQMSRPTEEVCSYHLNLYISGIETFSTFPVCSIVFA